MSIGSSGGVTNSAAGVPLAQVKGSVVERAQQDLGAQQRRVQNDTRAESAAGIGQTDGEDHATSDRDADGRQFWRPAGRAKTRGEGEEKPTEKAAKDPSGECGNQLDLSG